MVQIRLSAFPTDVYTIAGKANYVRIRIAGDFINGGMFLFADWQHPYKRLLLKITQAVTEAAGLWQQDNPAKNTSDAMQFSAWKDRFYFMLVGMPEALTGFKQGGEDSIVTTIPIFGRSGYSGYGDEDFRLSDGHEDFIAAMETAAQAVIDANSESMPNAAMVEAFVADFKQKFGDRDTAATT